MWPFHNVPAQDLAAGAACAISERSFVFFFFICLTGRRVVARRQGTFLSHVPGLGTRGCLFWGLLSSGSQLCFHKPVVSWVVEVVRWGRPAFAVMGGPLGDPEFFCVCVLGATGLSLTPLTPSLEWAGVRPAASRWRQCMWPGSSLPCCSASRGPWQATLPWGSLSPHLGMGASGPSSW